MEQLNSNRQWYLEVIEPAINVLQALIDGSKNYDDVDLPAFLSALLTDLEMIELDNFTTEFYVDKILDAVAIAKLEYFKNANSSIKPLALIAYSKPWERVFYFDYWRLYRPLMKRHPELSSQSIVNLYNLHYNLRGLVNYLKKTADRV